jgi:7-cyano-7-deazaguanine synthase
MKKAIVLISGGADSATVLAIALKEGYQVHAISFDYGQKHLVELEKAKIIASKAISHKIIKIDASIFEGSALTNQDIDVPKFDSINHIPKSNDTADTYVPARNLLFLSYATSYAESMKATDIFIGIHKEDFSNYPDCRSEFIDGFQEAVHWGADSKINIRAPLINCSKTDVIRQGKNLQVDYSQTITCYQPTPQGLSCGKCIACYARLKAFFDNDLKDPILYV